MNEAEKEYLYLWEGVDKSWKTMQVIKRTGLTRSEMVAVAGF